MRQFRGLLAILMLAYTIDGLQMPSRSSKRLINGQLANILDVPRQLGGAEGHFHHYLTVRDVSNCVELRGGGSQSLRLSYSSLQSKYPLLMTMLLSSFVAIVGDVLSQALTGSRDFRRVSIFALLGGLFFGPVLHYWYGVIGRFGGQLQKKYPTMPKVVRVLCQVGLNQSVGAVLINVGFIFSFYALTCLVRGTPFMLSTASQLVKSKMGTSLRANWSVWPLASFLNFLLVPAQYRVLFTQCVAALYNMLLSLIANS